MAIEYHKHTQSATITIVGVAIACGTFLLQLLYVPSPIVAGMIDLRNVRNVPAGHLGLVDVSQHGSPAAKPLAEYDDPEDDTLRLNNLPLDALRELYRWVGLPFVLKLVCRALRDAWPEPIVTTLSHVVKTASRFRWAYRVGCPFGWDEELSGNMARHGALTSLVWARENGMPWDNRATRAAAKFGHLAVLAYVGNVSGFGQHMFDTGVFKWAAAGGHIPVMQFLLDNNCPFDEWVCTAAARKGQLEALKWAREHNMPWSKWALINAALGGHMEIIEWAVQNGAKWKWSLQLITYTAQYGKLEMAKKLRLRGFPVSERTCAYAAFGGHLDFLKWLRSEPNPCPWDSDTIKYAHEQGHQHVVRWAIDNGCQWPPHIID